MISLDLLERTPWKPRIASFSAPWPRPAALAEPSPDSIEPLPEWLEPLAWKPKRRGKLQRFLAQMLVQLLVINTLPPELQVASFALAVSPFWSPLNPEKQPLKGSRSADPVAGPAVSPDPATPTAGGVSEGRLPFVQCRRSDILLIGNTAVVSGAQGTRIDGQAGGAALVDFTDPASPEVVGYVKGVASRMAVDANNILFSGHKSFVTGIDATLAGVKTTALGNVALVEGTDPAMVVVGEGPRSAETFNVKFRVIPRNLEMTAPAKLEFRILDATYSSQEVTLLNGRGQHTLLEGFTFPRIANQLSRVRLVVNAGTPDELVSRPKDWKLSPFEVLLTGQEDNDLEDDRTPPLVAGTQDGHIGDVIASNEELQLRKERATDAKPASGFSLTWTQQGGILIFPDSQQQDDGHFETALVGRKVSGTSHRVQALKGDLVLGTSEPLVMLPGPAAKVSIVLPSAGPGTDGVVPADGTTEIPVVVEVRDANDNFVSDGTPVACAQGGDGEPASESEATTATGFALCTYRADRTKGTIKLTAEVDGIEAEKEITNDELQLSLAFSKPYVLVGEEMEVTLTARTAGGETPANGTPVGWLLLAGRGSKDEVLTSGQARLRVRFDQENLYTVVAVVQGAHITGEIVVASAATVLQVTQASAVLAGDLTADSLVPLPRFDGSTRDVPVKATNQVTISGGTPGETVRLALGTVDAPNRLPEAEYLMETLADGVMVDSYGRHSGQATGEVRVDTDSVRRGYRFAGGVVSIPVAVPLAQPMGLAVGLAVKPDAPGVLLEREGSFSLALVESGSGLRVRLTAVSGGVDRVIESAATVALGSWSDVSARFVSGTMELQVAGQEETEIIGSVDVGTGDLLVGASFSGSLDELRLFHTSGASPPLLYVDDGSGVPKEEAEATFDASGQAFFSMHSSGILDRLDQPSALRPDGDTPLQGAIRAHVVRWRARISDGTVRSLATYLLGKETAAMLAMVVDALVAGGSADSGIGVVILDGILGFTPLGLITTPRDVVFALERVALGTAGGWDAFTLTTVALTLVFAAVISKRFAAADKAFEALQAWHRLRQRAQALPNLARWVRRAGEDPVFAQRMKATLQILTQHGDDVTDAAIDVVKVAEKNWRYMIYLERTLTAAGEAAPDVIRALRQTLDVGPEVLQTTLAVTRTADKVTPKVVSAGRKIAMAVDVARKAGRAAPGTARYNAMLKTFLNPATREILEDIDDIADASTQGLHLLVTQLGVPRAPFVYIADAAEAVVRYTAGKVKSLGKRVAAFERKVEVPVANGRQKKFFRQYDSSFDLGGGRFLDVDVKDWTSFAPRFKEARKLQKDIVIQFLDPLKGNYDNLRWAIPSHLRGSQAAIERWMLSQFNSRLVKSRIRDPIQFNLALSEFKKALGKGLIEFY